MMTTSLLLLTVWILIALAVALVIGRGIQLADDRQPSADVPDDARGIVLGRDAGL